MADFLELTRNVQGREYAGSNYLLLPRPERTKRYDGAYIRFKSSLPGARDSSGEARFNADLLERILLTAYRLTSVKFYGYQSEMVWSVPSAGGCYPFEVYAVVRSLEGIEPGVYAYSPLHAALYRVSDLEHRFLLEESLLEEDRGSAFHIVLSVVPWRSCWKYSYRGYRYSLLDSGHLLANFQFVLQSLNLTFTSYAHVRTPYIKTLLRLDKLEEPVSLISVHDPMGEATVSSSEPGYDGQEANYSRPITTDTGHQQFDWTPLLRYQEAVRRTTKEPQREWLASCPRTTLGQDIGRLSELIVQRRSCSAFLPVPLPEEDWGRLLSFLSDLPYPYQLFVILHKSSSTAPGLYQVDLGRLIPIGEGDYREQSGRICFNQEFVCEASAVYFMAFDTSKLSGQPAWSLQRTLIEAGCLGQAMYLKCREMGIGYSSIGGYYEDGVRQLFGLPPEMEIFYAGVLGKEDPNSEFKIKKDRYELNKPSQPGRTKFEYGSRTMIVDRLYQSVQQHAGRTAVIYGEDVYTYDQLWQRIRQMAEQLKRRIPNGYPVGICMRNSPDYLFVYYGLLMNGHIPMLIDHTLTNVEIAGLCRDYHIGTVITLEDGRVHIQEMAEKYPDYDADQFVNVATCRFSSGTTGKPKCLMFTHDAICSAAENWSDAASILKSDLVLCTALFHNGLAFNTALLSVFLKGAALILPRQITPKTLWQEVLRRQATILVAFPVVYDMLSKSKYVDIGHSIRLCISSAAPLHENVKRAFLDKSGLAICDYYGIVEAGPATFNDGRRDASVGYPIPGVQLRIVDERGKECAEGTVGTLQIKSASMAKGYYKVPGSFHELITPDGYYHSSDRAYMRDGHLYVVGRKNDLINVAGKKVDPAELENVLLQYPSIRDAAVAGMLNASKTSEYPVAFVVADGELDEPSVVQHCRERLAPFKLPQKYIVVDQIPRSGVGKIKRQELINNAAFEESHD
ncbi:AMP-binding protein [Cohnella lubricantis]|uniref:AMP-binding protein n=1 Tax=Cohnella lubricantis TaxID=2163172 RepID=A0A841TG83_9BACL|nr:AMP-binding protein [Cohnella lubricantis]